MRLADFILSNIESILVEWEAFARSIWPGVAVAPAEMRDHAAEMLRAAGLDMQTSQTGIERSEKSEGKTDSEDHFRDMIDASKSHSVGRMTSGFDLMAVMSEYRALRATVLRLWRNSNPTPDVRDIDDITRFNEALDQSITEAVRSFTTQVTESRRMFLGILGHDLRNPLNAMTLSAQMLAYAKLEPDLKESALQIVASANAMGNLLTDLLDFTGHEMTGSLPLNPKPMNLGELCVAVVAETRAANPGVLIRLERKGDLTGRWDGHRMRQVLSNLLGNACQHKGPASDIDVTLAGDGDYVELCVRNDGTPIPPELLPTIFKPLTRGPQTTRRHGSVGLGLYIVSAVVEAHAGRIDVTSSAEAGTRFTVTLPRTRDGHVRTPPRDDGHAREAAVSCAKATDNA